MKAIIQKGAILSSLVVIGRRATQGLGNLSCSFRAVLMCGPETQPFPLAPFGEAGAKMLSSDVGRNHTDQAPKPLRIPL